MRQRAASRLAVAALGLVLCAAVAIAAPGDLDSSFSDDGVATIDWGGDDVARALAIQPDGQVVVVGTGFGAPVDIGLSRLNTDGTLDLTFNEIRHRAYALGGVEEGHGLALQEDGKIVAVGSTDQSQRGAVTRTSPDGTPDAGWGVQGVLTLEYGGEDVVRDVVIQPDGKIVTVGYGGAANDIQVTRLTTAAVPDATFAGAGTARSTSEAASSGSASRASRTASSWCRATRPPGRPTSCWRASTRMAPPTRASMATARSRSRRRSATSGATCSSSRTGRSSC